MKTTVEVRMISTAGKSEAALRGRKLKDLIEEGLRLVLETPCVTQRRQSLAGLISAHAERWTLVLRTLHPILSTSKASVAMGPAIVDTGPLVAFFDRAEQHHPGVIKQV